MKVLSFVRAFFLGIICLFFVFPLTSHAAGKIVTPTNSLTSGLVGWWTFDGKTISSGTVTDQSGQGHSGTLSGTTVVAGKMGQALNFNGSSDRVILSSVPSASIFTVSAWMKRGPSTSGDGYDSIYSSDAGFFLNQQKLNWWDGSDRVGGATVVSMGMWHMVSIVSDGTNLTVYLDGVSDGTAVTGANLPTNAGVGIGGHTYGPEYFNGVIDDVRVYNRALSPTEIRQLYNAGNGVTIAKSSSGSSSLLQSLVGWWTFDGGTISGTSMVDRSGSGNTATLVSTPAFGLGKIGQAFDLDGTSRYATVPSGLNSLITGNEISISAWVYPKSTMSCDTAIMTQQYTSGNYLRFALIGGQNDFGGGSCGSGGNQSIGAGFYDSGWYGVTSSATLPLNKWTHVVGTFDGSNFRIYLNGVLDNTSAHSGSLPNNGSAWNIGKRWDTNGTGDLWFNGKIDDVRVYNRALTVADAKQLYYLGR